MFNEIILVIKKKYEESKIFLKELIDELDDLAYLTDDFVEDDDVAPIKVCVTRWIGHLVKALQSAIKNFGIYVTDLEKFSKKEKNKKRQNFGRIQEMTRLLIPLWDGILFATVNTVERNFAGLAEEDSYSC